MFIGFWPDNVTSVLRKSIEKIVCLSPKISIPQAFNVGQLLWCKSLVLVLPDVQRFLTFGPVVSEIPWPISSIPLRFLPLLQSWFSPKHISHHFTLELSLWNNYSWDKKWHFLSKCLIPVASCNKLVFFSLLSISLFLPTIHTHIQYTSSSFPLATWSVTAL